MTDPRARLDAVRAQWLHLRTRAIADVAQVRSAEARICADARRFSDPALARCAELVTLERERCEEVLAAIELRCAEVTRAHGELANAYIKQLISETPRNESL